MTTSSSATPTGANGARPPGTEPTHCAIGRGPDHERSPAEDIANRLAAIADEISALPLAILTDQDRAGSRHLGAFARILLRERDLRAAELPGGMLGEPVWEMLLDLFAAQEEGKFVTISSACIASGVPATTALRHINAMENAGLLIRVASSGTGG